jgi:hypothetical protein
LALALLSAGCALGEAFADASAVKKKLEESGYANVKANMATNVKNNVQTRDLTVEVDRPQGTPQGATSDDQAAAKVAALVFETLPKLQDTDNLEVLLKGGTSDRRYEHPKATWTAFIAQANRPPGIVNAVMAKDAKPETFEPIDPASDFPADQAIFHAIVSVSNLPPNSALKAVWIAVDTHGAAPPNFVMDTVETKVDGTRNIHLTLKPNAGKLPKGAYKVDVFLGDKMDRSVPFTVAGG